MSKSAIPAIFLLTLLIMVQGRTWAQNDTKPKKTFSEKQLAQQQRMTDCNADATQNALDPGDRKAFMKTCLSGGTVTAEVGSEAASAPDDAASMRKEK